MAEPQDEAAFARLARAIAPHGTLLPVWPLHGGVSARITAFEIQRADGQRQRLIVRQHGADDLARNPAIADDEFRLLRLLHDAGLPTPDPVYLDRSGEHFGTPVIVVEYIEGESEFAPADLDGFIRQFAANLAMIHQVDSSALDLAFLPLQQDIWFAKISSRPFQLDSSLEEGRIRDALQVAWPWAGRNATVLLHGDYWPGNVLWRDGRLVGVIDWEDAALGDPLADLANSRLEILWAFGSDAMANFMQYYVAITAVDTANLPYWDLCAALKPAGKLSGWGLASGVEARMRQQHARFVSEALALIAAR